ncbi:hypothetical protein BJX68DRAFT_27466 [Aspergillus pseudodeflectus]|uniref:Nucleoside-diphosphate-sugar epimerase n=1 Tax=Aspergillus pseudodeflectus TaxID=176178 RepID=A0ABR4JAA9_9EURO
MKIIIAGATGYIGQELLTQSLAHPSITSVVALSRRDLNITHNKLRVVHMQDADFLSYSDPKITDELKGASACLWAIGIRPSQARDEVSARRVCVEFTAAAARAFQRAYADSGSAVEVKAGAEAGAETGGAATGSSSDGKPPFRFVYISGAAIERDQSKTLWYLGNYRRMRGEGENVLFAHAEANPGVFEAYAMRPGLVPSLDGTIRDRIWSLFPSARKDLLAKAMIDIALKGHKESTFSNQAISEWGNERS